jgi:dTDP-4-amino-4,6-dideoxygalactose transaminase
MTNVQAAFLYEQLNDLECILNLKKRIFNNYEKLLQNELQEGSIAIQSITSNCEKANWIFAIHFLNNNKSIDEINDYFIGNCIDIRPFFYPYYEHKHLKHIMNNTNDKSISEMLNKNIIMLPSYPELTFKQQDYIVSKIKIFINS